MQESHPISAKISEDVPGKPAMAADSRMNKPRKKKTKSENDKGRSHLLQQNVLPAEEALVARGNVPCSGQKTGVSYWGGQSCGPGSNGPAMADRTVELQC